MNESQATLAEPMAPTPKSPNNRTFKGRFANNLKRLRLNATLSVKEAADRITTKRCTCSASLVYQWERGVVGPSLEHVPQIAQAYGCTVGDIFAG